MIAGSAATKRRGRPITSKGWLVIMSNRRILTLGFRYSTGRGGKTTRYLGVVPQSPTPVLDVVLAAAADERKLTFDELVGVRDCDKSCRLLERRLEHRKARRSGA